jgi:CO dehydrogenase maturation factor
LEHLGRGTAKHIGAILIVADPSAASARTAARIAALATGLGMRVPGVVLNKLRSPQDADKVLPYLGGLPVIAALPTDPAVAESESVPEAGPYVEAVERLRGKLAEWLGGVRG